MKYKLRVPEPCHEDWNKMTPTEKGRFCAVCERNIYDFTHVSPYSLAKKLKNEENVCGRFSKKQLDRWLKAPDNYRTIWNAWIAGVASLFAINLPVNSKAQTDSLRVITQYSEQGDVLNQDTIFLQKISFEGVLRDRETKEPLLFANVVLRKNEEVVAFATTDFDGLFSLDLGSVDGLNDYSVELSLIGYGVELYALDSFLNLLKENNSTVTLKMEGHVLESCILGMPLIEAEKPNLFKRIGHWFKRLF